MLRKKIVEWIEQLNLSSEAEPKEIKILKTPLGDLSRKQTFDVSWEAESLSILAWALKKASLPVYDIPVDGLAIANTLGFIQEKPKTVLHSPELLDCIEIASMCDYLSILSRYQLQFSANKSLMDFEDFFYSTFGSLPLDGFDFTDNDLEVRGGSICKPTKMQRRTTLNILKMRYRALNWLLGQHRLYSQVMAK